MKRIAIDTMLEKMTAMINGLSQEVSDKIAISPTDNLNKQINDRSWSAIQCIEHLNAYYRYYIPVFRGKMANSRFKTPSDTFSSSPLGRAVYRSVKLGKVKNVKRKLKSPKDYNPLVNQSLSTDKSIEEYLNHNLDFLELLKEASKVDMRKVKVPLSLRPVVKLNLGDALLFMVYHNERHIFQAKNTLSRLK